MTKEIWKWALGPVNELEVAKNTEFLHADVQNGTVCIWGFVDTEEKQKEVRKLLVIGTGHPIPDDVADGLKHISTTLGMPPLVWHVFEFVGDKK
jgi:hypothetical protein